MEYTSRGGNRMESPAPQVNLPPPPPPALPAPSKGTGLGVFALLLALGAVAGMAFVYFEPIVAFESLKSGSYGVPPDEQAWMMRGRMREAGIPLIASSGGALLAFFLGLGGKRSGPGKAAIFFSLVALGAAGYVWAMYHQGIINAL